MEWDIPELLDRPCRIDDLAARTGIDVDTLERVLRYAAGRGFVAMDRRGRFRASAVTAVLRRDHPNSWRGWVDLLGSEWQWNAWRHLDGDLAPGVSAIEASTGHDFFEYVNRVRPDAGRAFNSAMAAGATIQALALTHGLDWEGTWTVCDVGGGTGAALEYLLATHDQLRGVLLDLPEVVADARPALQAEGRCRIVAGSFFDAVPPGCDRYLLLAVVHDWDDTDAAVILSRVREALTADPSGRSRAIVVESILPRRPEGDVVEATHLMMRVLATGRERTRVQFDDLFRRSGLAIEAARPLASGFTAFILRVSPSEL